MSTISVQQDANSLLSTVLHEPVTGVFHTQHSTEHNRDIAAQGLILLCEVGSTMHGVSQDSTNDDIDEMGICIEPPEEVLGLGTFEQYEYRTQPVNKRSGPGDIDRCIYSLRKWTKLAAAGNPTVLMPLFADREAHVRYIEAPGINLRDPHTYEMLLSKQAGRKFLGYLDGQRSRYLDPSRQDSKHASRPELIEKYGWDTKTGYHAIRLAIQGIQLMRDGTIELPMYDTHREFLLGVRSGRHTKEEVTEMLDGHYIPKLRQATELSFLPDKPDTERINRWLADTYISWWNWKGLLLNRGGMI